MPPYDELWPAEFAPREPLKLLDQKFSHQFLLEQARAFVWGQQPTIANFQTSHLADRVEETMYMMRLAKLRNLNTNFLLYGTFLRPPEIHAPEATLKLSRLSIYAGQQGGLTTFKKNFPEEIAGAWRAPDGDLGIVLASLADESLTLSFTLDPTYYHLPRRAYIYRADTAGREYLGRLNGNALPIRLTLSARSACVLEFSRRPRAPADL
jgi:hypothetical protein